MDAEIEANDVHADGNDRNSASIQMIQISSIQHCKYTLNRSQFIPQ